MNAHDIEAIEGQDVVCACGRRFTGSNARTQHAAHHGLEQARAALRREDGTT